MKTIVGHVLGFVLKRLGLLRSRYVYGLKKQRKDVRDLVYTLKFGSTIYPDVIDNSSQAVFPIFNQLRIGSCVGNGVAASIRHLLMLQKHAPLFTPSRLFLYYNARSISGDVNKDEGTTVRDGIKAANSLGVCPEAMDDSTVPNFLWTYEDNGIKFKTKPTNECYSNALLHKALKYEAVKIRREDILDALLAGHNVVLGFRVHRSFESDETTKTGVMKVPGWFDPVLGGHCILVQGALLNKTMGPNKKVTEWLKCRNSWGSWGDQGYFYMPLKEVFLKEASDAWVITLVS